MLAFGSHTCACTHDFQLVVQSIASMVSLWWDNWHCGVFDRTSTLLWLQNLTFRIRWTYCAMTLPISKLPTTVKSKIWESSEVPLILSWERREDSWSVRPQSTSNTRNRWWQTHTRNAIECKTTTGTLLASFCYWLVDPVVPKPSGSLALVFDWLQTNWTVGGLGMRIMFCLLRFPNMESLMSHVSA